MVVKWPTGGGALIEKGGSSVIHQATTLLGCGEITPGVQMTKSFCWRKQNAAPLQRRIKARHRHVQTPIGGDC